MAQIIPCDGQGHEPAAAVFLITMITEAETLGLCAACSCDWAQALLQELSPDRLAPPPAAAARRRKPRPTDSAEALDGPQLAQVAPDASG